MAKRKAAVASEPACLTERAAAIHEADLVAYWMVLTASDLMALIEDRVPEDVKKLAARHLQLQVAEGREEHLARLAEVEQTTLEFT